MANQQDELEALRAQLAALTVRIYQVEQRAGLEPHTPDAPTVANPIQPIQHESRPPSSRTVNQAPPPPFAQPMQKKEKHNLEKKIGQHLLNRIDIDAVLIAAAYFQMYAINNKH